MSYSFPPDGGAGFGGIGVRGSGVEGGGGALAPLLPAPACAAVWSAWAPIAAPAFGPAVAASLTTCAPTTATPAAPAAAGAAALAVPAPALVPPAVAPVPPAAVPVPRAVDPVPAGAGFGAGAWRPHPVFGGNQRLHGGSECVVEVFEFCFAGGTPLVVGHHDFFCVLQPALPPGWRRCPEGAPRQPGGDGQQHSEGGAESRGGREPGVIPAYPTRGPGGETAGVTLARYRRYAS